MANNRSQNLSRRGLIKSASAILVCSSGFNLLAAGWRQSESLPYRVQEIYPTVHQGKIYVAGGLSPDVPVAQQRISSRVEVYNPQNNQWQSSVDLPEPRHHPQLISANNQLYAIGGFIARNSGRWSASRDVLKLNLAKNKWDKIGKMPKAQSETVATVINGKIHMAGGRAPSSDRNADWGDQSDIGLHQVFNPKTNQWTESTPLPTPRNSAAGIWLDGLWYVVGGRTVRNGNLSQNEAFDPKTKKWINRTPLPQASGGIAGAAISNSLFIFGGEYFSNNSGVYKKVWQYFPKKDQWLHINDMPVPRHGLGAVTLNDSIYVIAGATQAGGAGTSDRMSVFEL